MRSFVNFHLLVLMDERTVGALKTLTGPVVFAYFLLEVRCVSKELGVHLNAKFLAKGLHILHVQILTVLEGTLTHNIVVTGVLGVNLRHSPAGLGLVWTLALAAVWCTLH